MEDEPIAGYLIKGVGQTFLTADYQWFTTSPEESHVFDPVSALEAVRWSVRPGGRITLSIIPVITVKGAIVSHSDEKSLASLINF